MTSGAVAPTMTKMCEHFVSMAHPCEKCERGIEPAGESKVRESSQVVSGSSRRRMQHLAALTANRDRVMGPPPAPCHHLDAPLFRLDHRCERCGTRPNVWIFLNTKAKYLEDHHEAPVETWRCQKCGECSVITAGAYKRAEAA